MKNPKILQVIGFSGSGKTTFISSLIKALKERHSKVVTIKSARHHKYGLTEKDTDIFLESGSDFSVAIFENATQITSNNQMDLEEILEHLEKSVETDLIILEGFKEKNYPKILFWTKKFDESSKEISPKEIHYVYANDKEYQKYEEKILDFVSKNKAFLENDINKLVKMIVKDFKM